MKRRVIILGHEPAHRELWEFVLAANFESLEFVVTSDGDAAWEKITAQEPDLLIMDNRHHGLSGKEILKRLSASKAKHPILLISALDHEADFADCIQGLRFVFRTPPYCIQETINMVGKLTGWEIIKPATDSRKKSHEVTSKN